MPIRVQSAARANREILSEHNSDDRYSEYEPTDATEDSVTFTATATSRMRSEARMTPSAALLATRELINNEPCADLHDAWVKQIANLLNVAYPAVTRSIAPPPPGAQPPPRPHQRLSQAGPRGQGAAAAPQPTRVGSSCQEVVRSPEGTRVPIERRHQIGRASCRERVLRLV